jgi:hypothetical protein
MLERDVFRWKQLWLRNFGTRPRKDPLDALKCVRGDFREGIFDGIDAKEPVTIIPVKNIML